MTHGNLRLGTLLLAATILVVPEHGLADRRPHRRPLTIAVYGDAPYGTGPTDTTQLEATPAFIDAINADPDVGLVLHVGDIHSGSQYCTEAYDRTVAELWELFEDPLIYTPGDNEWTDCHKKKEGGGAYDEATGEIAYVLDDQGEPVNYAGGDPVANLELIRSIFFRRPGATLGGGHMRVLSQAAFFDRRHPEDRAFVENVMWVQDEVLFVTLNLPGGSNNDQDVWYGAPVETDAQRVEREARTGADLRWLEAAFFVARVSGVRGVLIATQADMWDPEKGVDHQAGFEPIVESIATHTTAFEGPVLLLNGDSHEYLSDNPLSASDPLNYMHPGYDVPNFHRVVVHGSTLPLEYLRLVVDPRADAPNGEDAFGPFRWERVTD